ERAEDEVSCIDEEHMTDAGLGLVQPRLQLDIVKRGLIGGVLRQVFLGGTGMARTRCHPIAISFRNFPTWVGWARIPVNSKIRWQASAVVRTGCCSKAARIASR